MSANRLTAAVRELCAAIDTGEALHRAVFGAHVFAATGDFEAVRDAEAWLRGMGFSVGRMEAHSARGILFGDFDIQKWRNLRPSDRDALHGRMIGGRAGPVTVRFSNNLPPEGVAAVTAALVARLAAETAAAHPMPIETEADNG